MKPHPAALLALCGRDPTAQRALAAVPGFAGPAFQASLRTLAERHNVLGVVLLALERSQLSAQLDPGVAEEYGSTLRTLRRQAALWDMERDYLLERLRAQGIPVLLLKGSALRLTAYRDPVERSFGDLDLLVPEAQVDAAVAALTEAGYRGQSDMRVRLYREHHHHVVLAKEMGFVVELHWALEPKRSPFKLDPEAFREAAVLARNAQGQPVLVPAPEHHVLHLATQNLEDGYCRLSRIVDLDRVVVAAGTELDWDRAAAQAIRMQVNPTVAVSLRLAELMLHTPIPAGLWASLAVPPASRLHLALLDPVSHLLEQRVLQRESLERLLVLWSIPSTAARRDTLWATLRGEQDWFSEVGLTQDGVRAKQRHRPRMVPLLKLLLTQLGLYWLGAWGRLSGGRQPFWNASPSRPKAGGDAEAAGPPRRSGRDRS